MILKAVLEVTETSRKVVEEASQRERRSLRGKSSKREVEDDAEGLPGTDPPACAADGGA